MFKLDLKKAEVAFKAGRLGEAARLLDGSKDAEHALGQQLKDRLVAELVKRAQQHLADDRFDAVWADVGLAKSLGGHQVAVLAIQQKLEARERSVAQSVKDQSLVDAKAKMESLLTSGDNESVVRYYCALSGVQRAEPSVAELANNAAGLLVANAWDDFNSGRLDRCNRMTQLVAKVKQGAGQASQIELLGLLEKIQAALVAGSRARYSEAADELKKVQLVATDAMWISDALVGLQKCIQGLNEFMTGPMGLLDVASTRGQSENLTRPGEKQSGFLEATDLRRPPAALLASERSILQVDQVGSLLLLTGESFSIGTTSTQMHPDIVLQTEGMKEAVYIRRSGEDYLAVCGAPFVINGRSFHERLLADGDSIEIGKRGRLTFSKPVAASNTAVLQIKGSKLARRDIRSIVLVGDAVVFGDRASHFQISGLDHRVIVRPIVETRSQKGVANGERRNEFLIHQKGDSSRQLLRTGEQVIVGECQFSLTDLSPAEPSTLIRHRSQF